MSNTLFQKGHRLFTLASAIAILIAILHTTALMNVPDDENWTAAFDAMKLATVAPETPKPSLYEVLIGAWIQIGALLFMMGAKNLVLLTVLPPDSTPRVIRVICRLDGLAYAALAILFFYVRIPPPAISFALLAILYLACGWTARLSSATTEK